MQLPEAVANAAGRVAYEFAQMQPFLPTYFHLLASALFPIYAGAHSSLSRPSSAAKPSRSSKRSKDDAEDEPVRMEGLSPIDALLFPLMAGLTLGGLYFLIKWLQDPAILNKILNWYFTSFSVISVSKLVSDALSVLHSLAFPHDYRDKGVIFHVDTSSRKAIPTSGTTESARATPLPGFLARLPLPTRITDLAWFIHTLPSRKLITIKAFVRSLLGIQVSLGIQAIEGLVVGIASVLYYNFVDKPWWLTNLMGFGFSYGSLQILSPTTFGTGTLILVGLFFYDIYFVFYTPMMVTVAKSLDVPIKLLFPRPAEAGADPAIRPMSMLGLGDVVLPGIMIGLALRFDLYMYYLKKQTKNGQVEIKSSAQTSADNDTSVVKASYQSTSDGWGDRFWTYSFGFGNTPYTARGVFPKPYFHASLAGYVTGMLVTLVAMQISNHPQPALLYLVPGVLSSLWLTGTIRGELKEMWNFSDAYEDEEGAKKSTEEAGKKDAPQTETNSSIWEQLMSMSSFFSTERNEERAKKLDRLAKQNNSDSEIQSQSQQKNDTDSEEWLDLAENNGTIFSFELIAGEGSSATKTAEVRSEIHTKRRKGKMSKEHNDHDSAPLDDKSAVAKSSAITNAKSGMSSPVTPRYNFRRSDAKSEEQSGKRQRVD